MIGKLSEATDQVFISLDDGETGQVLQTSMQTYKDYYRLLGYVLLGYAQMLPGIEPITVIRPQVKQVRLI